MTESDERTSVEIVEMYPAPDETWITGPGGTYVHEISLPLFRDPEPAADARPRLLLS